MSGMFYRIVLTILIVLPLQLSASGDLRCRICSKQISGSYIRSNDGMSYCSEKCFYKTLPQCGKCKAPCVGRHPVVKNQHYCSEKCASSAMLFCNRCKKYYLNGVMQPTAFGKFYYCMDCSNKDKCLVCDRPENSMRRLSNGYWICRACDKNVISSHKQLEQLFKQVRNTLNRKLNFDLKHHIDLKMPPHISSGITRSGDTRELGLYVYDGEIVTKRTLWDRFRKKKPEYFFRNEKCSIEIMKNLPSIKAAEVVAHELAHDYMKHRWFFINDDLLREGYAEFVAAEYNRMTGNSKWNFRMEANPDKIYGDGYRLIASYYKKGGWNEIFRQLDKANKLAMPEELR